MHSWSRLEIITTLCGESSMKPLKHSGILLWIGSPAPSKWVGWQTAPTSYFGSRQPPMWETSTPKSMRMMSMEGRFWCSHSSNAMLAITRYMRKAQPAPWWACRAFTRVMLSSALASLLAWGSNCSSPGTSNWVETWRSLPSTSVKYTTR